MSDTVEWDDVTVPEKVEYEVEEEKPQKEVQAEEASPPPQPEKEEPKQEEIKELDGIETGGAQKRIRQLVRQRKEREEEIKELLKERDSLQTKLVEREKTFVNTQKTTTDINEQQVNDKVALAKSAYLEAYNSGDGEKVLETLEVLNKAQFDLDSLGKQKAALDDYSKSIENAEKEAEEAPQQQARPDPRAQEWASDNDRWFGKDNAMTAVAFALDAELKQMGYNPEEEDFYKEIDRRIRTEFPHKFKEESTEEPVEDREQQNVPAAQVVAGASRTPASSNKKVKLSQEDVRIANKWNIPLEVYAAEKLKVSNSEGDYTDISFNRGS